MKTKLIIALLAFSACCFAQNKNNKNNISAGGGKESYNGDLGNSWFEPEEEWYGFFHLSYSRYLNKSFDAKLSLNYGDYGHCREEDDALIREDGSEVLNMYSRLATGMLSVKYKFANGYILKENSRLAPYLFLGAAFNNVTDTWTHYRVNKGNYASINGGAGLRFNITNKLNLNYDMSIGCFTKDNLDYRVEGKNDMYLQNTFSIGYNF